MSRLSDEKKSVVWIGRCTLLYELPAVQYNFRVLHIVLYERGAVYCRTGLGSAQYSGGSRVVGGLNSLRGFVCLLV